MNVLSKLTLTQFQKIYTTILNNTTPIVSFTANKLNQRKNPMISFQKNTEDRFFVGNLRLYYNGCTITDNVFFKGTSPSTGKQQFFTINGEEITGGPKQVMDVIFIYDFETGEMITTHDNFETFKTFDLSQNNIQKSVLSNYKITATGAIYYHLYEQNKLFTLNDLPITNYFIKDSDGNIFNVDEGIIEKIENLELSYNNILDIDNLTPYLINKTNVVKLTK